MRAIDADEITAFLQLERNGKEVESLDEFPTIEPEPQFKIMRCKNCKYSIYADGRPFICGHPENNAWRIFDDFYCGRAKRRTDDKRRGN